jgi:hypothetical protein
MRLAHALIAKSIAETILVGVLAVIFYLVTFPASFHGWGEVVPRGISGWVVNQAAPADRVTVQLFIDGKFVASGTANLARPDVVAAGWSKDEWHGYEFPAPQLGIGEHTAEVYAVHASGGGVRQTLQLVGDPIRIVVNGTGILSGPKTVQDEKR